MIWSWPVLWANKWKSSAISTKIHEPQDTPGEPSTRPREPHSSRIARLFGAGGPLEKPDVRDLSGEQPNYIGEQEYYANHVKQGGAVMVVRTSAEQSADRAAAILQGHSAHTPGHKDGPAVRRVD